MELKTSEYVMSTVGRYVDCRKYSDISLVSSSTWNGRNWADISTAIMMEADRRKSEYAAYSREKSISHCYWKYSAPLIFLMSILLCRVLAQT